MAEATKTVTRDVNLNGTVVPFIEAVSNRGENRGVPFLKLEPKSFDAAALLKLGTAVGIAPFIGLVIKAVNKTLADPTSDAYTESEIDGKKSYAFDASKAAKNIADAIAGSVNSAKDELETRLAELHKSLDDVMEKIMPVLSKGGAVDSTTIMKLAQIRAEKGQIEAKLVKKARKPKPAEAPVAAPAAAK